MSSSSFFVVSRLPAASELAGSPGERRVDIDDGPEYAHHWNIHPGRDPLVHDALFHTLDQLLAEPHRDMDRRDRNAHRRLMLIGKVR